MTKQLISLIIILSSGMPLFSQQSGKIDYPQLGLSFVVPEGWFGQETEGVYLMGHNSIPGFIMLVPHQEKLSSDQMITETKAGLDLGGGSFLQPTTVVKKIKEGQVAGEFQGTLEYTPAKAYIIGMENPHGNGLSIIATTTTEVYQSATYEGLATSVANSVIFTKVSTPAQSSAPANTAAKGSLEDWKYQLGGTRLTYMESYSSGGLSGGGYNMKTEIHLCQEGYFLYKDEDFMSAGGYNRSAYTGGNSRGDGKWEIIQAQGAFYLILDFGQHGKKEYRLEWGEESKLLLNGYRYFRTWKGEYAPNCPY